MVLLCNLHMTFLHHNLIILLHFNHYILFLVLYSRFCLQSPNICEFCKMSWGHRFNSTVILIPLFQLSHCCTCHNSMSCNLIVQCLITSSYFKRVDILILLCHSVWSEKPFNTSFITTVQHFSNVNSTKYPYKCGILWSYSLILDSTSGAIACAGHRNF